MRASNRRVLDASARIDSPKDRKAKLQCQTILKCDSPASKASLPCSIAEIGVGFGEIWPQRERPPEGFDGLTRPTQLPQNIA
jgi:hypothetical protein